MDGAFTPLKLRRALAAGLARDLYVRTDLGLEKRCSRCGEYWPADTGFFLQRAESGDGLHNWCKACLADWRQHWRAAAPIQSQPTDDNR